MAGKRKLEIEIVGDAKGVGKAFGEAEGAASGFGTKMGKVGKVAGVAFAAIGAGALLAGKAALDWGQAAADDEAEQAIFEQSVKIAGASQDIVDAFNDQIAAGMKLKGFTDTELREAYAQAYGQSKDLAQSQEDVALAMDIARKAGVPLNAALDAVTKAHNGQTTALARMLPEYGALVKSAGSAEEALGLVKDATQGAADTFASTSQGQMDRAKIAFGEVTESIGAALLPVLTELAPVLQNVAAWLSEHLPGAIAATKAFINEHLIPIIEKVGAFFGELVGWVQEHWAEISKVIETAIGYVRGVIEVVTSAIQFIWKNWGDEILLVITTGWGFIKGIVEGTINVIRGIIQTVTSLIKGDWEGVWEGIKLFIDGIWTGIKTIIETALGLIRATISAAWDAVKLVISGAWDGIKSVVSGGVDAIVGFVKGIPGRIGDAASSMWDGIKVSFLIVKGWLQQRVGDVVDFFGGLPARITDAVAGMWDGIKNAFKSTINWIIGGWNSIEFKMPTIDLGPLGSFGGWTIGLPDIPKLHTGGIVQGAAGQEVPIMAQAGEGVFTPDQMAAMGGRGGDLHVHLHVGGSVIAELDVKTWINDGIKEGVRRGQLDGLVLAGTSF